MKSALRAIAILYLSLAQSVYALDIPKIVHEAYGLRLGVSNGGSSQSEDGKVRITCVVENLNDFDIRWIDSAGSNRFAFRIEDENGRWISPNNAWSQKNESEHGRRMPSAIPPGVQLSYALDIEEAFGSRWIEGAKLEVKWEPGDNNNGLFPPVWILKGEVDMFPLTGKRLGSKQKIVEPPFPSSASSDGSQVAKGPAKPTASPAKVDSAGSGVRPPRSAAPSDDFPAWLLWVGAAAVVISFSIAYSFLGRRCSRG